MSFDFANAESWQASTDQYLPVGAHVCTIIEQAMSETKTGKPQIELTVESINSQGTRRDWIVITDKTVGKVVQLFDACGAERPKDGEFNPSTGALTDECVQRLHGRKIGVVVRLEDSLKDPMKQEPRIAGYVEPQRISSDVPADTRDMAGQAASSNSREDDVPF
jgi:hypothetical protein